jgi:hypothetical protein
MVSKTQSTIVSDQSRTLIGAETGIENIAAMHDQCRFWVIRARAIQAPNGRLFGMPPIATAVAAMQRRARSALVSFAAMQKSSRHFAVADEPPYGNYGTSMPRAGVVHHINS